MRRGRNTLEEKVNKLKNHLTDVFSQIQVLEQLEKLVSQNPKLDKESIEIINQGKPSKSHLEEMKFYRNQLNWIRQRRSPKGANQRF